MSAKTTPPAGADRGRQGLRADQGGLSGGEADSRESSTASAEPVGELVYSAEGDVTPIGDLPAAEAEGREVTAADVDRAWRFKAQPILQSLSVEWFTPAAYVEGAREVLGRIDLDPESCEAANRTVQARQYFTAEDDGLARDWHGRVFCNPPYSGEAGKFAAKLIAEHQAGRVSAGILLVNAQATPNQWFTPLWDWPICFTDHRIAFEPGGGQPTSHPTFGACFVYVGPEPARFAEVFSRFGVVVWGWL